MLKLLNRCHGIGMVDSFVLKPHMFYLDLCGWGINPGLNFNLGSSFFCLKVFSWINFSWLFRASNIVPINLHRCWPREWKRYTWPASMLIYWNKRKHLLAKRVQLSEDFLGTPTWLPFHCFGTENENAVDNVIW